MLYAKWVDQDKRFSFSLSDNGGVEISEEYHNELITAQTCGMVIIQGDNGIPVASHPPAPMTEQLLYMLRAERDKRLSASLAVLDRHRNQRDFGLPTSLTDNEAREWAIYAQKLRDMPEETPDPSSPDWPLSPDNDDRLN